MEKQNNKIYSVWKVSKRQASSELLVFDIIRISWAELKAQDDGSLRSGQPKDLDIIKKVLLLHFRSSLPLFGQLHAHVPICTCANERFGILAAIQAPDWERQALGLDSHAQFSPVKLRNYQIVKNTV